MRTALCGAETERDCPEEPTETGVAITRGCVNTCRIVGLAISTPSSCRPEGPVACKGVGEPV
jgi:hypothetical protein